MVLNRGRKQKLKMVLSWVKNFGISNAVFMVKHEFDIRRERYDFAAPDEKEIIAVKKDCKRYHTVFAVLLCSGADEDALQNQVYENYHTYKVRENEDVSQKISQLEEEYVVFVGKGVWVSPLALWMYARKLTEQQAEIYYSDEILNNQKIFKPDFGIDTLGGQNYLGEMMCFKRAVLMKLLCGQKTWSDTLLYETTVRAFQEGYKIGHITKLLYQCNGNTGKTCGQKLDADDLEHGIYQSCVSQMEHRNRLDDWPLVSILIPNKDHIDILKRCIDSILEKSTYRNYEIVIIENNSKEHATFAYYKELNVIENVRVITCVTDWNYSYINNYGFRVIKGQYCIFLNNDTELISPDWIENMLSFAMRKDIGVVGAKLFYPDGSIQHGGVTLGIRGVAGHAFHGRDGNDAGYMSRLITTQNLSAVTAACMMIPKEVFEEVHGFDEEYKVAFNDTDLCMRIREEGYGIVFDPRVQLIHYESKSRGTDEQTPEKLKRFNSESMRFQRQWKRELTMGDPFYNPNLTTRDDQFVIVE